MTDVTQLIEQDHREVEDLFAKFRSTRDASVAAQICDELDRHAGAEEQVVYPAIKEEVPAAGSLVDEGIDEHKEARQLIGRIRQTKDEDHLAQLVNELEQAISHHVEEEESDVLPKAREAMSAERLDELGQEFASAKE
jgi:hemerythrin superfamily protein